VLIVDYKQIILFSKSISQFHSENVLYKSKVYFVSKYLRGQPQFFYDDSNSDTNSASFMTCLTIFTDFTAERFHCLFSSQVSLLQAITIDFGVLELGQSKKDTLV